MPKDYKIETRYTTQALKRTSLQQLLHLQNKIRKQLKSKSKDSYLQEDYAWIEKLIQDKIEANINSLPLNKQKQVLENQRTIHWYYAQHAHQLENKKTD